MDGSIEQSKLLVFKIGGINFGIDINEVNRAMILPRSEVYELPIDCDQAIGLINIEGKIVALIAPTDLPDLSGGKQWEHTSILTMEWQEETFAICTDGFISIVHGERLEELKWPQERPRFAIYCYRYVFYDNRKIWLLNAQRIFESAQVR